MMQRLDELTGPVEVGKFYLVPTVVGEWFGATKAWPVIGPQHHDRHCLEFANDHYHLDARFMSGSEDDYQHWRAAWGAPMMINDRMNVGGFPEPVWRRRKCKRLINPALERLYPDIVAAVEEGRSPQWRCHFDEWSGKQAKRDDRGWVCPHRNVSLADQPVIDGVVTCPLHLLKISAETGIVLRPRIVEEVA